MTLKGELVLVMLNGMGSSAGLANLVKYYVDEDKLVALIEITPCTHVHNL